MDLAARGELAAEIRLQTGHQKSGADTFAGNIGDEDAKPLATEIEKVIIVAADLASLDT